MKLPATTHAATLQDSGDSELLRCMRVAVWLVFVNNHAEHTQHTKTVSFVSSLMLTFRAVDGRTAS